MTSNPRQNFFALRYVLYQICVKRQGNYDELDTASFFRWSMKTCKLTSSVSTWPPLSCKDDKIFRKGKRTQSQTSKRSPAKKLIKQTVINDEIESQPHFTWRTKIRKQRRQLRRSSNPSSALKNKTSFLFKCQTLAQPNKCITKKTATQRHFHCAHVEERQKTCQKDQDPTGYKK